MKIKNLLLFSLILFCVPSISLALASSTDDGESVFEKTITIPDEQMWHTNTNVDKNTEYTFELEVTNGSAIDLLVLDTTNFEKYQQGFNSGAYTEFEDYNDLSDVNIMSTTFSFTVDESVKLYFAIENDNYLIGGADGGGEVKVHIKLTYKSKSSAPGFALLIVPVAVTVIVFYRRKKID